MTRSSIGACFFFFLVKAVLWLPMRIRFRIRVSGTEHLPKKGGYLLASNHQSGNDTILLPMSVPGRRVVMVAKVELFEVKGLGWLLRRLNAISVRRENASAEENKEFQRRVAQALEQGLPLGIFPEGTRSKDGLLGGLSPGVGILAVRYRCKVVPVGISYSNFRVHITFGESLDGADYLPTALTRELRRRIAVLSGQKMAEDDGNRKKLF